MSAKLPRYVEARLGERPDGYLLDGDHLTPLTLIEGTASVLPSVLVRPPSEALAEIAAVASTIASVGRTHASVSSLGAAGARVVALEAVDEGVLEMHRHELKKRKASAP